MPHGTLEVILVGAKGLEESDFLSGIDPYAIIRCQSQEKKSKVASAGEGSNPEWNETFLFSISEGVTELHIRLMDKDTFTADDFLGEVKIPLEPVFDQEVIPPTPYSVVKDENYRGEIKVGLKFTHERSREMDFGDEYGGWKQSAAY